MVAHDEGVIPAVAQAEGNRVVDAVLAVDIVAGDRSALNGVAVVYQNHAVHGLPLFRHSGGDLQIAVLYFLAVGGVEAVAFAVHVRGGVDTDGDGLLPVLRERGDTQAAQRHQQAQEQGREPPRVGEMFHTSLPFSFTI